jgi:hypothetical protein
MMHADIATRTFGGRLDSCGKSIGVVNQEQMLTPNQRSHTICSKPAVVHECSDNQSQEGKSNDEAYTSGPLE